MLLLGFDIGSSSVKVSAIEAESGKCLASAFSPKKEMEINAIKPGWAEQSPSLWWDHLKKALHEVLAKKEVNKSDIKAIGISYQMHGLVVTDKKTNVLRPSIIWCDSRAVNIGNKAFSEIGENTCLENLLNSPGNFTASKLKWVKENEPGIYENTAKIMLPGDYIAYRLTGEAVTTISGVSEGIFWDFKKNELAGFLFDHLNLDKSLIPDIVPTFSDQGTLLPKVADELGLPPGVKVTYRAGDQPNNAFSLNVLEPGEIAATAGTSGVVYGVSEQIKYDPESRVNTFAHVNHTEDKNRLGVLLCVNGTGILYSWLKKNLGFGDENYGDLNKVAAKIPIGSNGLTILPFGNGAERMLLNKETGCSMHGIDFNRHSRADIIRAAQEGIAFAFKYGMDIMKKTGIETRMIRAGKANMFLSEIFRNTLSAITDATIELYDTDGSRGAAIGAGVGVGAYANFAEAFHSLQKLDVIIPDHTSTKNCEDAYQRWLSALLKITS